MKSKKGEFSINSLGSVAIVLVVAAIIISLGGTILNDIRDSQTTNGTAYNVSSKGLESMTTLGDWLPTIAIIVAAAIIIGVVVTSFRT